eukprot:GGOE01014235.1.p1 GENE.GGOE01014235.1~~GGOE01014235.1.p1  ORF type:complete len:384 (-),score=122.24 GGOE01014235.1:177-1328(-)
MPVSHERAIVYSVVIIAALCFGIILFLLQTIILPFLFALIAMYLLQPLVDWLSKKRSLATMTCKLPRVRPIPRQVSQEMEPLLPVSEETVLPENESLSHRLLYCEFRLIPRFVAVFLAIAVVLGIGACCGLFVYTSLKSLQSQVPLYERGAVVAFDRLSELFSTFDIDLEDSFVPWAIQYAQSAAPDFLTAVSGFVEKGLIILIFLIYLLLTPSENEEPSIWTEVNESVRTFIVLKGAISAVLGVLVATTLWYLGVQCAMVFGLITLFCNFIPNVGALFAVFAPSPLVVFDPRLGVQAQVMAFAIPFLWHFLFGNCVEPAVLGDRFELHPVVVLLSLVFWALLWGVAGMILAVPIMAVMRIVLLGVDSEYSEKLVGILERFEA